MARRSTNAPRTLEALLLGSALALWANSAKADACPSDFPLLAAVDPETRLQFLARTFDREIRDVDIWSWTWGSVYAAGTAVQLSIIPATSNQGVRTDLAIGAISAGAGSAILFGLPLRITLPLRRVRGEWDEVDRCRLLLRAEDALRDGARNQALSSSVIPHIGNLLVNVGIGLILGLGYGQWKSAAISAGVGTAIGEANAFTQPHRLPGVLERYRDGSFARPPRPVAWWVGVAPAGAGPSVRVGVAF